MNVPDHLVPIAFRRRVRRELADATARARSLMPVRVHVTHGAAGRRYRRSTDRTCVACGVGYDETTPGCTRCAARAYMRARAAA